MPRWVGAVLLLFAATNALYGLHEARTKKFFFMGGEQISAKTYKVLAAAVFILSLVGAFLVYFGPWPKT